MNKKFILSLTILASMVSCREADEIVDNDKVSTNNFIELRKLSEDKRTISRDSFTVAKDSAKSSLEDEVKPPIKNGEHWRH
jgi:hypothetical protein